MTVCRAARKGGNGSLLWPKGCETIEDVPADLVRAIQHAFKILDWHENLIEEEIPPEWMWNLDHELEPWFERVDEDRKSKYGGGQDTNKETMRNEYAAQFRN